MAHVIMSGTLTPMHVFGANRLSGASPQAGEI